MSPGARAQLSGEIEQVLNTYFSGDIPVCAVRRDGKIRRYGYGFCGDFSFARCDESCFSVRIANENYGSDFFDILKAGIFFPKYLELRAEDVQVLWLYSLPLF